MTGPEAARNHLDSFIFTGALAGTDQLDARRKLGEPDEPLGIALAHKPCG
jgi:hypothetical protein